jgi:hypothetical protein
VTAELKGEMAEMKKQQAEHRKLIEEQSLIMRNQVELIRTLTGMLQNPNSYVVRSDAARNQQNSQLRNHPSEREDVVQNENDINQGAESEEKNLEDFEQMAEDSHQIAEEDEDLNPIIEQVDAPANNQLTNLPNESINRGRVFWPDKWTCTKGKSIVEAFYDFYVHDLPTLYNALQSKKKFKSIWYEISRTVDFMKYFLEENIPAPPIHSAPRMQRSEWEAKIASFARTAGVRVIQYLKTLKLRQNNNDTVSGNAKTIRNAPKPPGKEPVKDFYDNAQAQQVQITRFLSREANVNSSRSPSPPVLPTVEDILDSAIMSGLNV